MDFKGSEVKEIRTGRVGTVIDCNIDTVDVQYKGLRKLKCKWNQVQLLNDKDRVKFDKAIQKRTRDSELKSKELANYFEKEPTLVSVPQRHGYIVWTIFAAFLVWAVFSVKTPPPSQSEKVDASYLVSAHDAISYGDKGNTSYQVSTHDTIGQSDKSRLALSELISPSRSLHTKYVEPSHSQITLAELIDAQIALTKLNYDGSAYFGESGRSFRFYPITFSSSFSSLPVLP